MPAHALRFTALITLGLILAGCTADRESQRPRIPDCEDVSSLGNTDTPPQLYRGMVDCVEKYDYYSAVYFFALAGSYTYYDTLRVADKSAHLAHEELLQESLDTIGERKKQLLRSELRDTLANPGKLPAICRKIAGIGAPRYYPRYMILYGTGPLPDSTTGAGLIDDFDSDAAWGKALRNYLHCTGL